MKKESINLYDQWCDIGHDMYDIIDLWIADVIYVIAHVIIYNVIGHDMYDNQPVSLYNNV